MPPPLFDEMQIANALRCDALPALERLARSSSLRDGAVARFDRDEPPPYVSSTEDEDEDMPYPALDHANSTMSDALNRLLDEPLDDDQRDGAAWDVANQARAYSPGARYDMEVKLERDRVRRWTDTKASADMRDYFVQLGPAKKGHAGRERVNIIARRNIKRCWQKLGVWNPDWGIPDRANPQPNDNTYRWKWPWQHGDAAAEWRPGTKKMSLNSRHPVTRALRLRQGLCRSESSPVLPRSHLGEDASASQAESFITSRPWFVFAVEACEEGVRYSRLPDVKTKRLYKGSIAANVMELWKERGDWKAGWRDPHGGNILIGWKWPHESPSPEPEDLSGLDDLATFELTPSEVDALEAVPPPSPPTPRPVYVPPAEPPTPMFGWGPQGPPPAAPEEAIKQSSAVPDEPIEQPPLRLRRRRQQLPAQPVRRSARIAAMTANRPPTPRVSKPPARRRGRPRKNTAR